MQLFVEQLRFHRGLLVFWLVQFLFLAKVLLHDFGAYFILLEPEYGYSVNHVGMFLMGVAIGIFCLAWQLTAFILDGHKFYFLAMERRPFLKFSYNNALIPSLYWLIYLVEFYQLRNQQPGVSRVETLGLMGALVFGGLVISVLFIVYFSFMSKDIVKTLGNRMVREISNHRVVLRKARQTLGFTRRVDVFLRTPWQLVLVPDTIRVDFRKLVRIMDQNHANAAIVQVFLALALGSLWLFQQYPGISFPAGASFFLLFSFLMMTVGFVSFWFRRIGPVTLIILLAVLYYLNTYEPYIGRYYAYGLDYQHPAQEYSVGQIAELASPANVASDSLSAIRMLDAWLGRVRPNGGPKPRMAIVLASGGGNRSAYWTMLCLQKLDSLTNGRMWRHTRLLAGASGGMIGASFYRELKFRQLANPAVNPNADTALRQAAKDLLNPIIFNVVANLFFPNPSFESDGNRYSKERGYAFEQQLVANTGGVFASRRLADYAAPEASGEIPQLILTPSITNDGRQLVVGAHPAAYLCRLGFGPPYKAAEVPAVDFQRLMANHNAPNLRFTTAIRMSATFPYLLPSVVLPTKPEVLVMDAGLIDNFGVNMAARFLHTFRAWIEANTRGVVVLQIRDSEREAHIEAENQLSLWGRFLGITGSVYGTLSESRDFMNDETLGYVADRLHVPIEVLDLQYIPIEQYNRASLNFHLTEREKLNIRQAIHNDLNQQVLARLAKLFNQKEP